MLELSVGEDHVSRGVTRSQTCLVFRQDGVRQALQAVEYDLGDSAQQRNASVVVAIATITGVFIQSHNYTIPQFTPLHGH